MALKSYEAPCIHSEFKRNNSTILHWRFFSKEASKAERSGVTADPVASWDRRTIVTSFSEFSPNSRSLKNEMLISRTKEPTLNPVLSKTKQECKTWSCPPARTAWIAKNRWIKFAKIGQNFWAFSIVWFTYKLKQWGFTESPNGVRRSSHGKRLALRGTS